ncbi:MerR family transcriptional regulator [Gracilibacillus sp. D59]|uniref:MerR family transcriptional regulator n=1 Tax=Gracilibacillus sp. D59 TaxID=3457434 RepID=UPI003FCD8817
MIAQKYWKVGDLAGLTGLTIRTLRYYDQIGLLNPSEYSGAGYRLYSEDDIKRLQQILALKELDTSLEEIKRILENDAYNPLDVLLIQIDRLKENIRSEQVLLKELHNVARLMQGNKDLTVENFTKLLSMMRKNHENYYANHQRKLEQTFDKLDDLLSNQKMDKEDTQ